MKYIVEDTPDGYRLAIAGGKSADLIHHPTGVSRSVDEPGGHGPIEKLWQHASDTWSELRAAATG